jgi:large conductance mechanosensitive channel
MKKFFGEFKKFISRGNVMDMAVGVIVGGAFTAIVTSLTNNILKPIINWIIALCVGGNGSIAAYTILKAGYQVDEAGAVVLGADGKPVIDLANSIYIDWGAFSSAIINFLLVAFILFLILRAFNRVKANAEANKNLVKERKEALKAARGKGLSRKQAIAEYEALKAEEAAKAEEEAKAAAEAEANKLTRTEELLTEIKVLLAEKNK